MAAITQQRKAENKQYTFLVLARSQIAFTSHPFIIFKFTKNLNIQQVCQNMEDNCFGKKFQKNISGDQLFSVLHF